MSFAVSKWRQSLISSSFAENSLDKVHRLIRDHELNTTTKYALLKAPKDFGRKIL